MRPARAAGNKRVVSEAEGQQYRLLQPLIDAPALPCGFSHARISAIEQVQRLGHCLTHGSLSGKAQFRAIFPSSFDRGNQRIRHVSSLRSEEHTSELQSLMRTSYAVFCLKKKKNHQQTHT